MAVKNPDLLPLFEEAKALLAPYERRKLVAKHDEPGNYDLWTQKEVVIDGRKRDDFFFAGLIVQKSFVGFYYMPIYTDTSAREFFGPELLALLKGKSCFHLKKLTPEIKRQMKAALKSGYDLYKERGWI